MYSVLLPLVQTFQLLCCCSTRSILLSLVQTVHLLFLLQHKICTAFISTDLPCSLLLQHKIYTVLTGTDISTSFWYSTRNVLLSLAQAFHLLSFCSTGSILLWLAQTISSFLLQHSVYQQAVKVPEELKDIMNEETYNKARVYGLDNSSFSILKELFSVAITIVRRYLIELCSTEIDKTEWWFWFLGL